MNTDSEYHGLLDKSISNMFWDAFKISVKHPQTAVFFLTTMIRQLFAARRRTAWGRKGIQVPPLMIISVTSQCNLKCKGCYAGELHRGTNAEMTDVELRRVFKEAGELGISIILIAGGEPLSRSDLLEVALDNPKIIFPLFTNGLLLTAEMVGKIKRGQNIVPIISLEGYEQETDDRRGRGVFQKLKKVIEKLRQEKLFFGVSVTMTRENFGVITSEDYIGDLIEAGVKLFLFVEYVPVKPGTENLTPSEEQRAVILDLMRKYRKEYPGLFIAFPGDEESFGGCLSSGRGFVHIGSDGSLEPCPFAPYSDTNLKNHTLKEALSSPLLKEIRQNHDLLKETKGGCALWENREWVRGLAKKQGDLPLDVTLKR